MEFKKVRRQASKRDMSKSFTVYLSGFHSTLKISVFSSVGAVLNGIGV
jgi:hypothetical protein